MFTLLNPSALLALLGLLVPVAIHLWNRRPGREVPVGSLRWLAAGANRRLRSLKPEQLWLLLLRATLLAVLALAVAGPVRRQALPAGRGQVLLGPEVLGSPALATLRPGIDSLRRRGYGLRWLAAGFPKMSGAAWRNNAAAPRDSARLLGTETQAAAFRWARVQQAAEAFAGQPLYVVTSAALRHFQGSHAPLPTAVRWQALPDTATASWLASAELVGDSLQLLVGNSSETRTTFRRQKVVQPPNQLPIRVAGLGPVRFRRNTNGGETLVVVPAAAPASDNGTRVEVLPLVIEVYASPEFAADARYLEAALRAAAAGLPIPPVLRRVTTRPERPHADWTFWLSAEALPAGWQSNAANLPRYLWREAAGPGVADTARLAATEPATAAAVFRRGTPPPAPGSATVWADGRGRAILSRRAAGRRTDYQLHTRLAPAWSELADDPELPARLLALLHPAPTDNSAASAAYAPALAANDRRAIDPAQLPAQSAQLLAATAPAKTASATFATTDLRPWLVLAAGLLFLIERLLASRRERRAVSTPL